MGACFNTMEIRANDGRKLKKKFNQIQQQCRKEYGTDPYNGSWSTVNRVKVILDPTPGKKWTTKKKEAVLDYIEENAQKWDFALAVKARGYYIVGGWCAM